MRRGAGLNNMPARGVGGGGNSPSGRARPHARTPRCARPHLCLVHPPILLLPHGGHGGAGLCDVGALRACVCGLCARAWCGVAVEGGRLVVVCERGTPWMAVLCLLPPLPLTPPNPMRTMPIMSAPRSRKKITSPARSRSVCPGRPTITPVPTCSRRGVGFGGPGGGAGQGLDADRRLRNKGARLKEETSKKGAP